MGTQVGIRLSSHRHVALRTNSSLIGAVLSKVVGNLHRHSCKLLLLPQGREDLAIRWDNTCSLILDF